MTFRVTDHAIDRYRKRIEPCERADARDRLLHAASLARPASERQRRCANTRGKLILTGNVYLWCPVENLMLIGVRDGEAIVIVTVFRVPSDAVLRESRKKQVV